MLIIRRRVLLTVLVSLVVLLSTSMVHASWFQKYGIASKQELSQPASAPKLIAALKDPNAKIRKAATIALARQGAAARQVVPALAVVLRDQHPNVRTEAAKALGAMGAEGLNGATALLAVLSDRDANVRMASLKSLHKLGYQGDDFQALLHQMAAGDAHRRVKAEAAATLTRLSQPPSPEGQAPAAIGQPALDLPQTERINRYGVAVIIGNRNYAAVGKDVPDVLFAHNDADAMYSYVTESLGFREGNVILLKDASQADLVGTFGAPGNPKGKLFDWLRAGQSDVFVYYSGHGAPGLGDGRSYLLPVDADPLKVELNGYPLEVLYANLAQLPAKSTYVLLDACFSGLTAGGSVVKNASSITIRPKEAKMDAAKMTVLTASSLNQVASWDEKNRLGLFTSHFLQGVTSAADQEPFGNEDGRITLAELKKYLDEEVAYHARRTYGRDQNPQVRGNLTEVIAELE